MAGVDTALSSVSDTTIHHHQDREGATNKTQTAHESTVSTRNQAFRSGPPAGQGKDLGLLGTLQRTGRLSGRGWEGRRTDSRRLTSNVLLGLPQPPACLEQLEAVPRHPSGFRDASPEVLSAPGFLQQGRNRLDGIDIQAALVGWSLTHGRPQARH